MKTSKFQHPSTRHVSTSNIQSQKLPMPRHMMRRKWSLKFGASLVLGAWCLMLPSAFAQGTAFTYQGRLNDGANLANGSYDLRFIVYDMSAGGSQQGPILTNDTTEVSNGLFTVTLDFGNQFPGANRWLEIGVRTNGTASFFTLSPRQPLTPAPYAITAGTVISGGLASGTYGSAVTFNNAANSFSGAFTGNGVNVTNVNAAKLGGLPVGSFWQTSGNAGTVPGASILGTTDNQPLELWVNGARALKLIPTTNTVNLIGGSALNTFDPGVVGATVAGGGSANYLGAPSINYVRANYASIGGGAGNTASNVFSTVAGGLKNTASGQYATVGGGDLNAANGLLATAAGGFISAANGDYSTVGGGYHNTASGPGTFVGGGGYDGSSFRGNTASGIAATVVGGMANTANNYGAAVGGGSGNVAGAAQATIAGGNSNTNDALGGVIGGGADNYVDSLAQYGTVGGGEGNTASGDFATVAGGGGNDGYGNVASAEEATVSGGDYNRASAVNATVCGGFYNTANGQDATVAGGVYNTASGTASFAAGNKARANQAGTFVWADNNDFNFDSDAANQTRFRDTGGFIIVTGINGSGIATAGASLAPGATAWSVVSDRNAKKNFKPLDTVAVLNKLAAIPITHWNYKWEDETNTPHIGPMAQDFKAAFYPGRDDKSITTLEFDGVELAAIQGLNEKMEVRSQNSEVRIQKLETETKQKDTEIQNLKQRLEALEKIILNQKPN